MEISIVFTDSTQFLCDETCEYNLTCCQHRINPCNSAIGMLTGWFDKAILFYFSEFNSYCIYPIHLIIEIWKHHAILIDINLFFNWFVARCNEDVDPTLKNEIKSREIYTWGHFPTAWKIFFQISDDINTLKIDPVENWLQTSEF